MRKFLRVLFILSAGLCKMGVGSAAPVKTECTYSPAQSAFLRGAMRAFVTKKTPVQAQRAMLANAFYESKWQVDQHTSADMPDSASGGSHTAYQILFPNLEVVAASLGWTVADVVPAERVTNLALIELYGERQTLVALALAARMGIRWSKCMAETQVLSYFTRWAAGSWPWSRAVQVPAVALALRNGIPTDPGLLHAVAHALERQGKLITSSALFKLALYRQLDNLAPCTT